MENNEKHTKEPQISSSQDQPTETEQPRTIIYYSRPRRDKILAKEEVNRDIQAILRATISAMVEEMKRELQASMLQTVEVEEAVRKGLEDLTPSLVEVVQKEAQAVFPLMVEEMRKMITRFSIPLQHTTLPSSSRSLDFLGDWDSSRGLHLTFEGQLNQTVYTGITLVAQGISLKIALRDSSGIIVEDGTESCAQVRIYVLNGDTLDKERDDCSEKNFDANVVGERHDRRPLLVGNCQITLKNGVADADAISFTDNSSWVKSKKFRLGARVVKCATGVKVREAICEAFEVKECRLADYRKKTLSLDDKVWRLCKISRNGKTAKRLAEAKIHSVRDFLQSYHTDADSLKEILQVSGQQFQDIVQSATLTCWTNDQCQYPIKRTRVSIKETTEETTDTVPKRKATHGGTILRRKKAKY